MQQQQQQQHSWASAGAGSGGETGVGIGGVGEMGHESAASVQWQEGGGSQVRRLVEESGLKGNRIGLIKGGGVEALLEHVLSQGPERELALSGLVNLSMCKEGRVDLYNRLHALQGTMLSLMVDGPRGSKARGCLVNLFRNLSDTGGAENRVGMFNGGLAQGLVSVIVAEGGGDCETVNSALNCLTNLASQTSNRVAMMRTEGVLRTLVDVIKESEPNSRPLRNALVTLTNLSCHKDNRPPMMSLGLPDLLITLTLTASPDSKHIEAVLIMLVNLSTVEQCRLPLVSGGAAEAALAVISSCRASMPGGASAGAGPGSGGSGGGGGGDAGAAARRKNIEISLKIVQNLSASAKTGAMLLRHGALEEALRCARSEDEKVSAVAAGVLSNLALYAKGEGVGSDVRQRMLEAGVTSALQGLMDHPDRTGLSAAKAAAYLFGGGGDRDHPLLRACGSALGRLCHALQHTLDGKELYGVTFDVFELVLAIRDICVLEENRRILVAEGGVPLLVRIIAQQDAPRGMREVLLTLQALTELAVEAETAVIIRGSGEAALNRLVLGAGGQQHLGDAGEHGAGVDWDEARDAAMGLLVRISAVASA